MSQDLLNITLKNKVSGQTIEEISGQDLRKITVKKLRMMCKNSKISYNGNEGKDILIIKILEKLNTLEVDNSEQKKCSNHDLLNNHDHDNNINLYNNFENLFKTFGINFTKTNQEAVKRLLKTNTPEEVKDYLKDNYENIKNTPSVKSIASVFCSLLAKGEKQPKPSDLRVFSPLPEELIKYEKIFKNFGISFTKSNQEAVRKLLKTLSHKQTENYLKETYENITNTPGVSDISSLFSSKIQKGERQLTAKERKNLNNNEIKIKTDKEKDKIQAEEFVKNLTKNSDVKIDFDSLTHEEQAEIEKEAMEICCKEIKTDVKEKVLESEFKSIYKYYLGKNGLADNPFTKKAFSMKYEIVKKIVLPEELAKIVEKYSITDNQIVDGMSDGYTREETIKLIESNLLENSKMPEELQKEYEEFLAWKKWNEERTNKK